MAWNPEVRTKRFAELKAREEAKRKPVLKPLKIPRTSHLLKGSPIIQDLARLSFHREDRTLAMVDSIAKKYGYSRNRVYELLMIYEQTHTLRFPNTTPADNWAKTISMLETGVVGNGNRRTAPVRVRL